MAGVPWHLPLGGWQGVGQHGQQRRETLRLSPAAHGWHVRSARDSAAHARDTAPVTMRFRTSVRTLTLAGSSGTGKYCSTRKHLTCRDKQQLSAHVHGVQGLSEA